MLAYIEGHWVDISSHTISSWFVSYWKESNDKSSPIQLGFQYTNEKAQKIRRDPKAGTPRPSPPRLYTIRLSLGHPLSHPKPPMPCVKIILAGSQDSLNLKHQNTFFGYCQEVRHAYLPKDSIWSCGDGNGTHPFLSFRTFKLSFPGETVGNSQLGI